MGVGAGSGGLAPLDETVRLIHQGLKRVSKAGYVAGGNEGSGFSMDDYCPHARQR
jgi:hypothetical protein